MDSIVRIAAAIITISLAASISIDLNIANQIVPITGQSLAIIISALVAIIGYLTLGALGQPVFADGAYGAEWLTGKKAGYLWGFLLATFSISSIRGFKDSRSIVNLLNANVVGTFIILFTGFVVLAYYYIAIQSTFVYGVVPYWSAAVVKIMIVTFTAYVLMKLARTYSQ